MNKNFKTWSLIIFSVIATVIMFTLVAPIPQLIEFHTFSDTRHFYGIPNFANVISNLPFLMVGYIGLRQLRVANIPSNLKLPYITIYLGSLLIYIGSSFFHWHPDHFSLLFDRLPMTLVFMSLLTVVIAEQVSERGARVLWIPLLFVGVASVVYWYWSETQGVGDLRLYVLVQFLPMLLIPVMVLIYPSKYSSTKGYWQLFGCYLLAKLFEEFDREIFEVLGIVSGHTLKHIVAAVGLYLLLRHFITRKTLS
jgi:hypothetical protein